MRRTALAFSFALVLAPAATARGEKEPPPPATLAEVESRIREVLVRTKTPGAGVALVSREAVLWQAGLGKADVASGRDVTPETIFRIGSISKAFVGLCALILAEEAKLTLETPLRAMVPDLAFENPWEGTNPVRVVHLLEHTTGFDDMSLPEYAHSEPDPIPLREALAFRPASRVSRWRPGSRMAYCNSGPAMAAYVIERVTGRRFEDFVRERIFIPLGMTTASYFEDPATDECRATLYHEDGVTPYPYWHILLRPSGSVNASVAEMARFTQMLVNRGGLGDVRLVSPGSIERMEQPETTYAARAGLRTGYGLGNYATLADGFVFHGHDGGVEGGVAKLEYLPQEGLGFVVLLNSANGEALREIAHIARAYLTKDLPRPALPMAATLSPDVRDALDGYWRLENSRQEAARLLLDVVGVVRVDSGTDGFHVHIPFQGKTETYVALGGRLFRKKENAAAEMVLAETPEGERLQASNGQSFRPVSAFVVWSERSALGASLLLVVTSLLFAIVWVPKKLAGRLRGVRHLGPRVWGLLASLSFVGMHTLLILAVSDPFRRLGKATLWSVGVFALSVAFGGATVSALYASWRAPQNEQSMFGCWHARAVALGALVLLVWYAWFGLIGVRTWV